MMGVTLKDIPGDIVTEIQRQARIETARAGGKERAVRHTKAELRAWGKKGGRPKKAVASQAPSVR